MRRGHFAEEGAGGVQEGNTGLGKSLEKLSVSKLLQRGDELVARYEEVMSALGSIWRNSKGKGLEDQSEMRSLQTEKGAIRAEGGAIFDELRRRFFDNLEKADKKANAGL